VKNIRKHAVPGAHLLGTARPASWLPWMLACCLWATLAPAQPGPRVSLDSPIGFFTNVANRLLQSQLNLSLNRIQLYPTNQYTPALHRFLQVTANLYDATTNRTLTDYPYLPSVFRPLFTNDSGSIYITGYAEETGTDTLNAAVRDLQSAPDRAALSPTDMVSGVPLVIGAKKGYPNFNKFVMQTQVKVVRKLQFHRLNDSNTGPINEIDQMFVVSITNLLGVEAWNSCWATFPRPLRLVAIPDLTVALTNLETGSLLNPDSHTSSPPPVVTNIPANTWPAYNPASEGPSFVLPLASAAGVPYTNQIFLPASTYRFNSDSFVPLTTSFERTPGTTNLYVPHWQLNLRTRLRVALIDTSLSPERIVDYVNLDSTEQPMDIMAALASDGQCADVYTPSGARGAMWCTNRLGGSTSDTVQTTGIMNQVYASSGLTSVDWNSSVNEFPAGMSKAQAVEFFRNQFIPGPYNQTNTFNAPFQPFRNIYLLTSWQANDPLVHYTLSDLGDRANTNRVVLDYFRATPVNLLGHINTSYQPWGGNPKIPSGATAVDLRLKDPTLWGYGRSDNWDFPTNASPDLTWLGSVHRGTPWQTIYLKAPAASLDSWIAWTGDTLLVTNQNGVTCDASFTHPTNDWRLAAFLVSLLTTNDLHRLPSANQPDAPTWCSLLDGLIVFTNIASGQFTPLAMSSNSPQAAAIAAALDATRSAQPAQRFNNPADILLTPELSTASPWLDLSNAGQVAWGMTDAAYEAIPAQLLPLLRLDSVGSATLAGGALQIQFSGADGYACTVQTSSNLLNWTPVATNYPTNGSFTFPDTSSPGSPRRYYRSVLN
jgi:hypothetical protein